MKTEIIEKLAALDHDAALTQATNKDNIIEIPLKLLRQQGNKFSKEMLKITSMGLILEARDPTAIWDNDRFDTLQEWIDIFWANIEKPTTEQEKYIINAYAAALRELGTPRDKNKAIAASLIGSHSSKKKAASSAENGKKGGRPKYCKPCLANSKKVKAIDDVGDGTTFYVCSWHLNKFKKMSADHMISAMNVVGQKLKTLQEINKNLVKPPVTIAGHSIAEFEEQVKVALAHRGMKFNQLVFDAACIQQAQYQLPDILYYYDLQLKKFTAGEEYLFKAE